MLAANGIEFENVAIESSQALADLRASGKLPFDQMPLLEIDRLNLSQSSAMIRYLARKGDLYGDTDQDALWCDMIAGAVADFAEAAMQAAFQPTRSAAEEMLKVRFAKFGPRFEACLNRHEAGLFRRPAPELRGYSIGRSNQCLSRLASRYYGAYAPLGCALRPCDGHACNCILSRFTSALSDGGS